MAANYIPINDICTVCYQGVFISRDMMTMSDSAIAIANKLNSDEITQSDASKSFVDASKQVATLLSAIAVRSEALHRSMGKVLESLNTMANGPAQKARLAEVTDKVNKEIKKQRK